MKKFFKEIFACSDQPYVKMVIEPVTTIYRCNRKEVGGDIKIQKLRSFERWKASKTLEENFADEVAQHGKIDILLFYWAFHDEI